MDFQVDCTLSLQQRSDHTEDHQRFIQGWENASADSIVSDLHPSFALVRYAQAMTRMNVALKTLPAHHQFNGVPGSDHGAMCRFIRLMVHTTPQVDEAINSAMPECVLDQRQFEI